MTSDGYTEIVSQGTYNNGALVDYTTVYVSDGMNVTPDNNKKYQYSINGHDLSATAPISEVVTYAGNSITSDYWIYLTLTVVDA